MKRFLLSLLFILVSVLAEANPLYFQDFPSRIVIRGNKEYFYDEYGNLWGREDIGSAGNVYEFDGEGYRRMGHFVVEGDWCKYYNNDGVFLGKCQATVRRGTFTESTYQTRYYVDSTNRPVASYRERERIGLTELDSIFSGGRILYLEEDYLF